MASIIVQCVKRLLSGRHADRDGRAPCRLRAPHMWLRPQPARTAECSAPDKRHVRSGQRVLQDAADRFQSLEDVTSQTSPRSSRSERIICIPPNPSKAMPYILSVPYISLHLLHSHATADTPRCLLSQCADAPPSLGDTGQIASPPNSRPHEPTDRNRPRHKTSTPELPHRQHDPHTSCSGIKGGAPLTASPRAVGPVAASPMP